ncbi:MAG: amidase [Dethiobacteria bacterium]|nr:amidase [Dethiobacteria bacterium]
MYLHPAPLARIARDLVSGNLDLLDYINEACDLLEKVDPQVNAFLPEPDRRARLLKEGELLKSIYPDQAKRPPLYGVLIGVKDVYRVDGFPTRGGSKLDPEALAGVEADCVRLLRQAGALVMGKTVTTEFAYFEPGPTRNPHNLNHTPGGSSSGSAAAVAAGLAPLTLGTQTIGSVNRPAAFCGVVGYKPSYNRIPSGGLLYFSRSADHVGCFTQEVEGMLLAARSLVEDWQDISVSYKPVLGVPRGKYLEQASDEGLKAFSEQLERLRDAGYKIKEINALDDIETIAIWHRKLIAAEIALEHAELYAKYAALYRPRTAEIIEEGKVISKQDLEEGRKRQKQLREKLETQMRESEIDLWVTPAAPGPAPEGIDATGNPAMNMPWTNTGLPSVTIPAGRAENGLPLCLQFIAPFRGDELLLNWSVGIAELFSEYQAYNL